jgi:hypothetical protein
MHNIQPVILCGGSGTRLRPLSRSGFRKQFLCLTGDESLFQLAARRLVGLGAADIAVASPLIVTNEEHRFLAFEQLREIGIEAGELLLEPAGRNTAPALTLAALAALDAGGDPIVAVDPRYFRPTEVETLLGDPTKAKEKLGWTPKISFDELVAEMVREDLKSAERDELVKKHGYKTMDYHE